MLVWALLYNVPFFTVLARAPFKESCEIDFTAGNETYGSCKDPTKNRPCKPVAAVLYLIVSRASRSHCLLSESLCWTHAVVHNNE